jgi:signal recognition particle receptor subunit beta
MVVVNYSGKEINAKIVYYGPGLCGKTTNLERIYDSVPATNKGKMISMKTKTDRTLFFDFLPLELGDIAGFRTRLMLYTVPGQVFYNATRKLVLKGVDAVVFVADSERGKLRENQASLENLRENLVSYGIDVSQIPIVFQYNKRDLPEVYTREELDRGLDRGTRPAVEAVAAKGEGVFETLRIVSKLLLTSLHQKLRGAGPAAGEGTGAAATRESFSQVIPAPVIPRESFSQVIPAPAIPRESFSQVIPAPAIPVNPTVPQEAPREAESAWAAFPPATQPKADLTSFGGQPPALSMPAEMPVETKSVPDIDLGLQGTLGDRGGRQEPRSTPSWTEPAETTFPKPSAHEVAADPALAAPWGSMPQSSSPLDIVRMGVKESQVMPRQIVVPVAIDPSDLKDGQPIELILRLEVGRDRLRAA